MATVVRTQKHYAATGEEPLHQTAETVEVFKTGQGQAAGGKSRSRHSASQDANSRSSGNPDKTPSARAKVLPWVQAVETQGYQPPAGMFGPYDSQPPTRVQTMHDPAIPPPRPVHPFAYNPGTSLPFSALAGQGEDAPVAHLEDQHAPSRRPESEMLSRGAGVRYLSKPAAVPGGRDEDVESRESAGMGTFGREVEEPVRSKGATHRSAAPQKASPARSRAPPTQPLPATPAKSTATTRKPVPPVDLSPEVGTDQVNDAPHVHHPHHEHPFTLADAAYKQTEAMELARAETLARLEAMTGAGAHPAFGMDSIHPSGQAQAHAPGIKGPRATYDTTTSGPSFGHIIHRDGHPVSGLSADFVRVPFGVPLGATLPRPMMLMRSGTGMGMGIGLPGLAMGRASIGLSNIPESTEGLRKDERSAYVETVVDEEEPEVLAAAPTMQTRSRAPTAQSKSVVQPAKTESGIHPKRNSQEPTSRSASHAPAVTMPRESSPPPDFAPSRPVASVRPSKPAPSSHTRQAGSVAPSRLAPSIAKSASPRHAATHTRPHTATVTTPRHTSAKAASVVSDAHSMVSSPTVVGGDIPASPAPSVARTTVSNVKKLVADSKFHDETLCQLLDAARLNLIGEEAKKALNRAARARVIELRDLRAAAGMQAEVPMPPLLTSSPPKKEKRSKSKDRHHRKRSGSTAKTRSEKTAKTAMMEEVEQVENGHASEKAEVIQPTTPPEWALEIANRLAALDARFAEFQKTQHEPTMVEHEMLPGQDVPPELIDDLLFGELPPSGIPNVFSGPFGLGSIFPPDFPQQMGHFTPPQNGAFIQSIPPSERPAQAATYGGELSWGSEVELPQPGETVPPPQAPTITIQAPTESNVAKTGTRVPSGSNLSRAEPRTPRTATHVEVDIVEEQVLPVAAVPHPRERDLPAVPSESIHSHRPSPVQQSTSLHQRAPRTPATERIAPLPSQYASPRTAPATATAVDQRSHLGLSGNAPEFNQSPRTTTAMVTAPTHLGEVPEFTGAGYPGPHGRDTIHVLDTGNGNLADPMPWDRITQRLYSWAMVWEEETFARALENISLGKQVEEFPLTVFMMMTYKRRVRSAHHTLHSPGAMPAHASKTRSQTDIDRSRLVRRNVSQIPSKLCDKMFVPPNMSDAINKAVHGKNFANAQQILEELWYPFGFEHPPRVIIALAKHRNEASTKITRSDHWTAHRYDLASGHLTSYSVTHEEKTLADGRPFMWWHAIRAAWPGYNIPHPDGLRQRVELIRTSPEERGDNSIKALNYARNLLLGFRPELARDVSSLRETIWKEVKRLLQKKRAGRLIVALDSPDHVDEL